MNHPEDCGCQVCRNHQERLSEDPWYAEHHARGGSPVEDIEGSQIASEDPEPSTREVHVHHHHTEERKEVKTQTRTRTERKTKVVKRRGGILRTVVGVAFLIWVLHSFYPNLNVPLVPGVACTNGTVQQAGVYVPGPNITPPPGTPGSPYPSPLPEIGKGLTWLVKTVLKTAAWEALHIAGETFREMIKAPPSVDDVRTGLMNDFHTAGEVTGFVFRAVSGGDKAPDPNVSFTPTAACGSCPTTAAPAGTGGSAIDRAARAVLAGGWPTGVQVTALAVVGAESTYRPTVRNSVTASGLFQMKYPMHAALFGGKPWSDPVANSHAAYLLWKDQGWQPWTTYTSGAYRPHLAEARQALARVGAIKPVSCDTGPTTSPAAHTTTKGLQPITRAAQAFIRNQMHFTGTIYGYSYRFIAGTHVLSQHAKGLALDMMTTDLSVGQPIADYFSGPGAVHWRVHNVIWQDRIWTAEGQHWKPYGDHGGPTQNHMDHVHVDFFQ